MVFRDVVADCERCNSSSRKTSRRSMLITFCTVFATMVCDQIFEKESADKVLFVPE